MQIDLIKKLDLSYLGEDWNDCYLEFVAFTVSQAQKYSKTDDSEIVDVSLDLLAENFTSGKVRSKSKTVPMKATDIGSLPLEIVQAAVTLLLVEDNKKK